MDDAFARDMQRAYAARLNEDRVWLLPDTPPEPEVLRWYVDRGDLKEQSCMLRSEALNHLMIFHADEARRFYPPVIPGLSPKNVLPDGLYRLWLNANADLMEGKLEFIWPMPFYDGDRVRYRDATITCDPGCILPVTAIRPDEGEFELSWPPPGISLPSTVSPEFESNTFYGQLKRARIATEYGEIDCVISEREPTMRAMPIWMRWPEPFNFMFPTGGGIDLLHHRQLMRTCVKELAEGQIERALRTIEIWVNRLSGETETRLERAWFLPKLLCDPERTLFEAEGKFDIACATIDELICTQRFRELMRGQTKVVRVQGWLGYFWWELYQDVKARVSVRLCKGCGQVIRKGHSDRQYCTRAENPQCFRERNGAAQRHTRAKRDARTSSVRRAS
ncbi:MAG TPA: hypothetical protein VH591_20820 [Ktedonobacterales bacterium]